MSVSLWRIAPDARTYAADDLTGTYTASSRALACLETVVHLNASGLPLKRYLIEVDLPDDLWASAEVASPFTLAVGWDAEPAGHVSIDHGSDWVANKRSAVLRVPSVIVPEEENVLINPSHADASRITARKVRRWLYDPRLRS